MKNYKRIVIALSVIIGIGAAVLLNLFSPVAIPSYKGSITSESYQILKDYAFEVASNSDTESKQDVVVTTNLTKDFLIVKVDTSLYGVEAIFPVSNYYEKIENGIIKYEGIIDYNNVTYSEHTDVNPPLSYLMISIMFAGVCAIPPYFLFYVIPSSIIKALTKKH